MYSPQLTSANKVREYHSQSYQAVFLDQIVAKGSVQYEYLIAVFKPAAQSPFLIVSSEKSNPLASLDMMDLFDGDDVPPVISAATYFFCYFDEKGHYNMGSSSDWGDAAKFEQKALAFIEEKLGEKLERI